MDEVIDNQTVSDEVKESLVGEISDQNDEIFSDCLEFREVESDDNSEQIEPDLSSPLSDSINDNVKTCIEAHSDFNDVFINSPNCTTLDPNYFASYPDMTDSILQETRFSSIQELHEINGNLISLEERNQSHGGKPPFNPNERNLEKLRVCGLCHKYSDSLSNCLCCSKELCIDCLESHTAAKPKISSRTDTKNCYEKVDCDSCKEINKVETATSWCKDCSYYLCQSCSRLHQSRNVTKSHSLYQVVIVESTQKCDWCAFMGNKDTISTNYCSVCKENLCKQCFENHQVQQQTKYHIKPQVKNEDDALIPIATKKHTCNSCASNRIAESVCETCGAYLCESCVCKHTKSDFKTDHTTENLSAVFNVSQGTSLCGQCAYLYRETCASMYCLDCEECLCSTCEKLHLSALDDHRLISVDNLKFCSACFRKEIQSRAEKICVDCVTPLPLCVSCCDTHLLLKPFRGHKMKILRSDKMSTELKDVKQTFTQKCTGDRGDGSLDMYENESSEKERPGRPTRNMSKNRSLDAVSLVWQPPKFKYKAYHYQIRYKIAGTQEWTVYEENIAGTNTMTTITDLKSNTKYIFQVRMICDEKEGPYSSQSEEIKTLKSAAGRMLDFSLIMENSNSSMNCRKILSVQNSKARNTHIKSRKLEIGVADGVQNVEKTIMLVGATGSGKSTLVDGMANYLLGVNWDDTYRVSIVDLEEEEQTTHQNQAISQTQWITCYTIHPIKGSRLKYSLNIIDTPGFGDTKGIERDQDIIDQIRMLFHDQSFKGIACIDAVCFIVKAPDARLTHSQRYIFDSILSLFGNDIKDNISFLITFADGNKPPVLQALKEWDILFGSYFLFNNSGLFASNSESESLTPMFWKMGMKSFAEFFRHLDGVTTKSLGLTMEVLDKRNKLEITVENILPLIDAGLHKVDELSNEIKILQTRQTEIIENKDFIYTVKETRQIQEDLPAGQHVTNCINCHMTCHKDCKIPDDKDKDKCKAIDRASGICMQCSCHWTQHRNTPYIFEYKTEEITKTYAEKLKKYNIATSNEATHKIVVCEMEKELTNLEDELQEKIKAVNTYTNKLKEIALRPNPLSVEEYINLLIETEKTSQNQGYLTRVKVLQKCKKKSNIEKVFHDFQQRASDVRKDKTLANAKKKKNTWEKIKSFTAPWK